MVSSSNPTEVEEIKALDAEFQRLTGREAFVWVSSPTPTTVRVAFADGSVFSSEQRALSHMTHLLRQARDEPEKLPYPFDQELTPEQDLRVINGWPMPS